MSDANRPRPAKILIINLYTEMGGNEYSMLNLVKALDRARFTPVMLFNAHGPFVEKVEQLGVETAFIPYRSVMLQKLVVPAVCRANAAASRELYRFLRQAEIDIIHCSDVLALMLVFFPVLRLRIPVVYHVVFFYEWMRIVLFNIIALFVVKKIIANSFAVEHDIKKKTLFLRKKTETIHNGVDASLFHPGKAGDGETLRSELGVQADVPLAGMVGRFDPVKGHKTFLEAASMILRRRDDVRFVVVGGLLMAETIPSWKRYRDRVLRMHHELGLEGKVFFVPHRDDMPAVMRSLDLFVCPSLSEAFGLVILEAVASGVPLVASRTVGALEAVEHEEGVYVAEAGNAGSFANAIMNALQRHPFRERPRLQASPAFLDRCSWGNYARKVERVYASIVSRN